MRRNKTAGTLLIFVSVLTASLALGGYAAADPLPEPPGTQVDPGNALPSNPEKWVCHDSAPATQQEIDEWCNSHQDRGTPLPMALRTPPPVSDFQAYKDYSDALRSFLLGQVYADGDGTNGLHWISDKNWRMSGPSVNPPGGDFSHNYGPHFPLKVYYSPEMIDWLCNGRKGEIPDGAMMVKAMALFILPPFVDITASQKDGCMDVKPTSKFGTPLAPNLWAPMLKSNQSSFDGWLWMLQQVAFGSTPPQFPPPLFDISAFTLAPPPMPTMDDPSWYPTGSVLEQFATKVPDIVMLNPLTGFPYCLSCHATAKTQSTFASMDNILGKELRYKEFKTDVVPSPAPTPGPTAFNPFPSPLPTPSADFVSFFNQLPQVSFTNVWNTRMPAESWEQSITSAHGGPAQFLTSAQCNACHNATPQSPLMPNMVFVEDKPARSSRLRNLSPYGEWHVSPMGLAGRDPIFFSQLQGETNNLSQLKGCIENTCLHCHAAMGQRQLAIDTASPHAPCRNIFAIAPPNEVPFGTPLARSTLQEWPGSTPSDQQLYAALGRDGISCAVCHHISKKDLGQESVSTGNFVTGNPDEIFGPYKNDTIVPKPMGHALGLRPKFATQISSSDLCGSCHDILLPIFDNSGKQLSASYEQSTHLEWLNSDSGRPGPKFRSCQDCHMPTQYKGHQLKFKIANSESNLDFPPTTNRLSDRDIALTVRDRYFRHSLHGLNTFLNQFFQQFPLILGFQQVDWMSEQPSFLDPPAPPVGSNFVMELPLFTGFESMLDMAQNQTATLQIGSVQKTAGQLSVDVTVKNLTGHYLPTGVGFRRMFLQLLVLDSQGNTLWASGRTNDLGFILDGTSNNVLQTEQPLNVPNAPIQPHYQVINSGSQVQIYQEVNRDSDQVVTTRFLSRVTPIKDNRIRPKGFDPKFFAHSHSQYIRDLAVLHGAEANDPDYFDRKRTGQDTVEYDIPLDPATLASVDHVEVTLYYQSIPPYYLEQRFQDASQGPALQDDIQRLYYLTSHLNLTDAKSEKGDAVLQGWKLQIADVVGQVP